MKVWIVDDEAPARDRLRRLLGELDVEVAGESANGTAALADIERARPDVVLLDVRMPGMDGLAVAAALAELDPAPVVVFATAYGDYALDAFESEAVDYVLKPVRRDRLERALGRAARLAGAPGDEEADHLTVNHHGGLRVIPLDDIVWFSAEQKYTVIHHRGGEAACEEPLKRLEERFGERFVRIHRNALVARTALMGLERTADGGHVAVLAGTDVRPEVSRRHVGEIKELLKAAG